MVGKIPLQELWRQKRKADMATQILCIPRFFTAATSVTDETMQWWMMLQNAYAKVKSQRQHGQTAPP